ncbi:uncharacterized protein AMSG_11306 [Thecamonas trahens ATCC 50062]|uniref:C2 domain-containing protein n=1 Tax=Thecamonas trahens ATCC 50062 TaxID=461836 RepID=A0A0L0DU54_THETB|nr:hypothetical protein AMSG_11306 [Thecamonas trahens ATCC 50062]KNC55859.1 hypothetical protein AMSG_11306 [Thecamonas trahens ATCC 50062]|eukprot:XP_013752784.1 hypothetical protein AMSG_11306 [Thecamonas trahens ATCC 50062]
MASTSTSTITTILTGVVQVTVCRGRELLVCDKKSSDPFVVVQAGAVSFRTPVVTKSLAPVWADDGESSSGGGSGLGASSGAKNTFLLPLMAAPGFSLQILDWDRLGPADAMGTVFVSAEDILTKAATADSLATGTSTSDEFWFPVAHPSQPGAAAGQLAIKMLWTDQTPMVSLQGGALPAGTVWLAGIADNESLVVPHPAPMSYVHFVARMAPTWSSYNASPDTNLVIDEMDGPHALLRYPNDSKLASKCSVNAVVGLIDAAQAAGGRLVHTQYDPRAKTSLLKFATHDSASELATPVAIRFANAEVIVSTSLGSHRPAVRAAILTGLTGLQLKTDGLEVHKDGLFHAKAKGIDFDMDDIRLQYMEAVANALYAKGLSLIGHFRDMLIVQPHCPAVHGPQGRIVLAVAKDDALIRSPALPDQIADAFVTALGPAAASAWVGSDNNSCSALVVDDPRAEGDLFDNINTTATISALLTASASAGALSAAVVGTDADITLALVLPDCPPGTVLKPSELATALFITRIECKDKNTTGLFRL